MGETKFGTFDELLELGESSVAPVAVQLREIVMDVDPEAVEVVRLGDRAATYGLGPKKMSEGYCYIRPYEHWVNLGFYRGSSLADPEGLLEGTGSAMRHVKVRTADDARRPAIRRMVEAALSERRRALGQFYSDRRGR